MSFEQGFVTARDDACGMAGRSASSTTRRVTPDPASAAGPTRRRAARSGSRVAAVPFLCAGLGRHDRRPQFRSRRVGSGAYARTSHCIRSGKADDEPVTVRHPPLWATSRHSACRSPPMSLFAAKM